MADDTTVMLQVRLTPELYSRLIRQRDRWGMTNQEIVTRILEASLPGWETSSGPPGTSS